MENNNDVVSVEIESPHKAPPDGESTNDEGIPTSDSSDSGIYDKEIKALQRTLQYLGVDESKSGVVAGATGHTGKPYNTRDIDDDEADELSDDFVPTHLVSVSPARHLNLTSRRRSDPGRLSLLHSRSPFGSSDSSEDDEMAERSPRARSPRRFFGVLPEDDCYPSSVGLSVESRNIPGWASPRRRMYQTRHSQSISFPEDSPRRGRTRRSNSLPLPDRSVLAAGEAIGAIATHLTEQHSLTQGRQVQLKRNRCISIDEPALEAIMEENMATALQKNQKSIRRYSMPTARTTSMLPPRNISP